jgi:pimeloyl-ACP methyl ester carboxylesterase
MAPTRLDHDDVAAPDGTLRVATAAEGPLVVFCHGFPGSGQGAAGK